jgi:hypothetical protein
LILNHFTTQEAKEKLEAGIPYDKFESPIHGTYDHGQGKFAGDQLYLSLDDDAWRWNDGKELFPVAFDLSQDVRKYAFDSLLSLRNSIYEISRLAKKVLDPMHPSGEFWDFFKKKYEIAIIANTKKIFLSEFFNNAFADQVIVFNLKKAKVVHKEALSGL